MYSREKWMALKWVGITAETKIRDRKMAREILREGKNFSFTAEENIKFLEVFLKAVFIWRKRQVNMEYISELARSVVKDD